MPAKTSLEFLKYSDNTTEYRAGTIIFNAGEPAKDMFVVQEGAVELFINGALVERVEAGGVLGEMALIDRHVRSATARAAQDCKLVPIDAEKFAYMVRQTPYFALDVMRVMARRLRNMNGRNTIQTAPGLKS